MLILMPMSEDDLKAAVTVLLVTEEEALKRLAVAAKSVIAIDRETGRPIYRISTARLSQKDRLVLELVADRLFAVTGLSGKKTDRAALTDRTGIKRQVVAARFKELKDEGWIERFGNGDRLTTTGLVKATDLIERLQQEAASTT